MISLDAFRKPAQPLVDFIVCGTQKGGTTALDVHLREHPDIHMAVKKEVHFFDRDKHFVKSPNYAHYHRHFSPDAQHNVVGEATPIYMYWKGAIERIWAYNPSMKLIAVLRDPVERAYSHWNMEVEEGNDNWEFIDAVRNETDRCREALPQRHRFYSYVDRGFYAEQIRNIWRYFPKQQTLFLKSDALRHSPDPTLAAIASFLNISAFPPAEQKSVHSRQYQSPIGEDAKQYLRATYYHDICELEKMLDWDCSEWK